MTSSFYRLVRNVTFSWLLCLAFEGTICAAEESNSVPATAASEKTRSEKEETDGSRMKVRVERTASGRKVFRITTGFVIEGRIQKPNAFYVLQRSQINYDWAQIEKDFTPAILRATEEAPF